MSLAPDTQRGELISPTCPTCGKDEGCECVSCIDDDVRGTTRPDDEDVFTAICSAEHFGDSVSPDRLRALRHDFQRPEASPLYPFESPKEN